MQWNFLAGAILTAACHGAQPARPAPQPTAAEVAMQQHVRDSLAAQAAADSAERARVALAQARVADSVARAEVAAASARAARDSAAALVTAMQNELGASIHFASAQARLEPEDTAALDRKVALLNANPALRLRITGACDERGSDQYNLALGTRRAAAARRYLVKNGIDGARLDQTSIGEASPVDTGIDESAWARNRRVEFAILDGDMPLTAK